MMVSRHWIAGSLAALVVTAPGRTVLAASTPEEALTRLKDGNSRFVAGTASTVPTDRASRERAAAAESPLAIVLSCADASVPPEYIFNAGLGELYVVSTAGQVPDKSVVASVEHATTELHTPLLVVMGHTSCAVVRKAVTGQVSAAHPNVMHLMGQIRPAAERAATQPESDRVRGAIFANIEQVINDVLRESAAVAELVDAGKLQVVGAYYDMSSGRVAFTKPVTQAPLGPSRTGAAPQSAAPAAPGVQAAKSGPAPSGHGPSAHDKH
jgi:carbonic anhydrase